MTETPLRGFNVRAGAKENIVVEIDYFADPAKDDAWAAKKRAALPNESKWLREYCRRWNVGSGDPFYPEFVADPKRYIHPLATLLPLPVVRGWDFGYRRPACTWMQYSPRSDRLIIIRELLLQNIDTHSFRDLVRYVSGEIDLEDLLKYPKAVAYVNRLREHPDPRMHPPWFDPVQPIQFLDFGGPEALQRRAAVEGEKEERCDAEILEAGGVHLSVFYTRVSARTKVIRRLLQVRPDGWGGLLIDPVCVLHIQMYGGALTFAKPTLADPEPEGPHKDGYWDNIHDADGYAVVNVVPVAPPEAPPAAAAGVPIATPRPTQPGTRTLPWQSGDITLEIKELLHPNW